MTHATQDVFGFQFQFIRGTRSSLKRMALTSKTCSGNKSECASAVPHLFTNTLIVEMKLLRCGLAVTCLSG